MQRRTSLLTIAAVIFFFISVPTAYAGEEPEMDVHFINVGQGDSMLIHTPSDKHILIDAGRPEAGDKVTNFLKEHNVEKLDLVIATHPDIDHIGGLPKVMDSFDVAKIMDTGKIYSTRTYAKYVSRILQQQIPFEVAEENEDVTIDPYVNIRVLNAHKAPQKNNAASIVLQLSFKETDFLLMGDVGGDQEKRLMEKYDLDADILKVGHHGSYTSTSWDFLQAVDPDAAILTYGQKNEFRHPVDRVMTNLEAIHTSIYPTAMFGDITVQTDGEDYMICQEKNPTDHLKAG